MVEETFTAMFMDPEQFSFIPLKKIVFGVVPHDPNVNIDFSLPAPAHMCTREIICSIVIECINCYIWGKHESNFC